MLHTDKGIFYAFAVLGHRVWIIGANTVIYGGRRQPFCRSGVSETTASHRAVCACTARLYQHLRPSGSNKLSPGRRPGTHVAAVGCGRNSTSRTSPSGEDFGAGAHVWSPQTWPRVPSAHRNPPSPYFTLTQQSQGRRLFLSSVSASRGHQTEGGCLGVTETELRGNRDLVHNWCAHHLKEQLDKVGEGSRCTWAHS